MISITSKSPYAVLALAELGRSAGQDPVPIGELARKRDVPVQFLEQLFAVLRRAGVISSQRGVKGGYRSLDMGYLVKQDTGSFTLKGIYIGIVARY